MSGWRRLEGVPTACARTPTQKRGVALAVVETLLDHGSLQHAHRGCHIVHFGRSVRSRLLREGILSDAQPERWRRAYLVLTGDGRVRTAGWRYRRIRRHQGTARPGP